MSADDIITKIAAISSLTARDIEDLRACDPNQLALLMQTYEENGLVENRGVWVEIGNALKQSAEYLPLAQALIGIAGGLAAIL